MEEPKECAVCLESLAENKVQLQCGHWFHKACIVASCSAIRETRKYRAGEWIIESCPLCRAPITDDCTRICGHTEEGKPMIMLIAKNMSISLDEGDTWSDAYDNPVTAVTEIFGNAPELLFERYSVIRDRSLFFTQSSSLKTRNDLTEIFTFWPQNYDTDDFVCELVERIDPAINLIFTGKRAHANARVWLSLCWTHRLSL